MADAPNTTAGWYLKLVGESVYGPIEPEALRMWATQGRIAATTMVSQDKKSWVQAATLQFLGMTWSANLANGTVFGPFNIAALGYLVKRGKVSPSDTVSDSVTKRTSRVDAFLKESSQASAQPAPQAPASSAGDRTARPAPADQPAVTAGPGAGQVQPPRRRVDEAPVRFKPIVPPQAKPPVQAPAVRILGTPPQAPAISSVPAAAAEPGQPSDAESLGRELARQKQLYAELMKEKERSDETSAAQVEQFRQQTLKATELLQKATENAAQERELRKASDAKLDELNRIVGAGEKQIAELSAKIATQDAASKSESEQVLSLESRLKAQDEQLDDRRRQIAELSGRLASAEEQRNAQSDAIGKLTDRLNEYERLLEDERRRAEVAEEASAAVAREREGRLAGEARLKETAALAEEYRRKSDELSARVASLDEECRAAASAQDGVLERLKAVEEQIAAESRRADLAEKSEAAAQQKLQAVQKASLELQQHYKAADKAAAELSRSNEALQRRVAMLDELSASREKASAGQAEAAVTDQEKLIDELWKTISSQTGEIKKLREEIRRLESHESQVLQQERESLQRQVEESRQQADARCAALDARLAEVAAELDKEREAAGNLKATCRETEKKLAAAAHGEKDALRQAEQERQSALALQEALAKAERRLSSRDDTQAQAADSSGTRIVDLSKRLSTEESLRKSMEEENIRLKKAIAERTAALEEHTRRVSSLKAEIDKRAEDTGTRSAAEVDALRGELTSLGQREKDALARLDAAVGKAAEMERDFARTREELTAKIEELTDACGSSGKKLSDAAASLADLDSQCRSMAEKNRKLEHALAERDQDLAEQRIVNAEAEKRFAAVEQKHSGERAALEREIAGLSDRVRSLVTDIAKNEQIAAEAAEVRNEADVLRKSEEALRGEIGKERAKLAALEQQFGRVKSELSGRIENLTRSADGAAERVKDLSDRLKEVESQRKSLQDRNAELEQGIARREHEAAEQCRSAAARTAEAESRLAQAAERNAAEETALRGEISGLSARIRAMEVELETSSARFRESEQRHATELDAVEKDSREREAELASRIADLQKSAEEMDGYNERLRNEVSRTESAAAAMKKDFETRLKESAEKNEATLHLLEKEKSLRGEAEDAAREKEGELLRRLANAEERARDLEASIADVERRGLESLRQKDSELELLKAKIGSRETYADNWRSLVEKQKAAYAELDRIDREREEKLQTRITELEARLSSSLASTASDRTSMPLEQELNARIAELREASDTKSKENERLRAEVGRMEVESISVRSDLESRMAQAETARKQAEDEIKCLKSQLGSARPDEMSARCDRYEKQLADAVRRAEGLEARLSEGADAARLKWYMKAEDGAVYGPVDLPELIAWTEDSRVGPAHLVSMDNETWMPASGIPQLAMEWTVDLADGAKFGPVHVSFLRQMLDEGVVGGSMKATHRKTGEVTTVDGALSRCGKPAA